MHYNSVVQNTFPFFKKYLKIHNGHMIQNRHVMPKMLNLKYLLSVLGCLTCTYHVTEYKKAIFLYQYRKFITNLRNKNIL